ncbi:MAG: DUF456 family protein [bacterium]|nr:DUF456 family protein [bacterium]MDT8365359.1 DUF456 family protein [bacterium]
MMDFAAQSTMVDLIVWLFFGSVMIVALPLQLVGLPGTWLLAVDAFLFRWLMGPDLIDYHTVIILGLMALFAEVLEFLTAVHGVRLGPPVRGAVAASIVGAFVGGLAGAPIMFGLGAIPGMAIGAWLAVFTVGLAGGASLGGASRAAMGALTGRIKGTAFKMFVAVAMVAVIIMSLVF